MQITVKHSDALVCVDCYHMHEAGECHDPDPAWRLANYSDALSALARSGVQVVSGDSEQDEEFSRRACGL